MKLSEALSLTELSAKTLGNYTKKAGGAVNAFHTKLHSDDPDEHVSTQERRSHERRVGGILKARVKMRAKSAVAEGELSELSKKALTAYTAAASVDVGKHHNKLWYKRHISADDEKRYAKRTDGIIAAKAKIKLKEAAEIIEVLAQASQVQQLRQQNVAKRRVAAYGTLTTARQNTSRKRRVNQAARYRRGIQNRSQPAGMSGRHHGLKAH